MARPPGAPSAVVVLLHGLGENRTGNNYLFRDLADGCLRAGFAAVRFDLPGCGESRQEMDIRAWDLRIAEVTAAIDRWSPGTTVHWVARGLSGGLLPDRPGDRLRVVLSPPSSAELLSRLPADATTLRPRIPLPADEVALWTALGAEPNLVGGLRVPVDLVRALAERLTPARYDLAVLPAEDPVAGPAVPLSTAGPSVRMATADPLFRFESDRVALAMLVPQRLRRWRQWLPAPS
ncbi:hypothetical protein O7626_19190 [Micromonospora sp. WMMD1102]|uniref:alpha/beta hydrolase n=1 Tax=Micromonospora sp. WMMD1102 TaxID=3016105 RepID=UPI0024154B0C|nr:alpha/beta fold hydrolase [Micromonospora sp. WMMD1102]MDG4788039.1 hypothetical protein [Micromonospora sp. WMMD1102]